MRFSHLSQMNISSYKSVHHQTSSQKQLADLSFEESEELEKDLLIAINHILDYFQNYLIDGEIKIMRKMLKNLCKYLLERVNSKAIPFYESVIDSHFLDFCVSRYSRSRQDSDQALYGLTIINYFALSDIRYAENIVKLGFIDLCFESLRFWYPAFAEKEISTLYYLYTLDISYQFPQYDLTFLLQKIPDQPNVNINKNCFKLLTLYVEKGYDSENLITQILQLFTQFQVNALYCFGIEWAYLYLQLFQSPYFEIELCMNGIFPEFFKECLFLDSICFPVLTEIFTIALTYFPMIIDRLSFNLDEFCQYGLTNEQNLQFYTFSCLYTIMRTNLSEKLGLNEQLLIDILQFALNNTENDAYKLSKGKCYFLAATATYFPKTFLKVTTFEIFVNLLNDMIATVITDEDASIFFLAIITLNNESMHCSEYNSLKAKIANSQTIQYLRELDQTILPENFNELYTTLMNAFTLDEE
ncbi:hypothetical protein TRFO_40765 [Tritrichomonas foetus]|uniref:Uncharacterized protein n=1 Tax=Tritrichomonas foetus TaxID=1144522 RepID=A0A1J4J633_9EUKA|nr:hypothetical protein TRFO_40765 [Tritrichomonas foetus]|eukprot:OHS92909.1 hypothetical protein TRFO_40765 [Tritrichomonas foetus]